MSFRDGSRRLPGLFTLLLAQAVLAAPETDLSQLELEDLLELEVTSVSKRPELLTDAAAAVTVLTGEEIRRSGFTSVADALRMVPGLHVANMDANRWAVSSRGFNGQFANKLLVLIDGRSVYTPLFSGVFWDVQDVMLEDVERIEVVRGPGGTLWGANAVGGVVNIITRSAEATQGFAVSSGGGTLERGFASGRYGGSWGEGRHYRVYAKYFDRRDFDAPGGGDAHDAWSAIRGGARFDLELGPRDRLTLQGDFYDGESEATLLTGTHMEDDLYGGNVVARWTRSFSESSQLQLQTWYDATSREDLVFREDRHSFDVELQHRFAPLPGNDLVWGLGYRLSDDDLRDSTGVLFAPSNRTDHLFSGFLQNELSLLEDRLRLTLGAKFEHNDYTGFEFQPNARLLGKPHERHTLWAAVSRAVRSPSRADDDVTFLAPGATPLEIDSFNGNHGFDSEQLLAYEIGYRVRPVDALRLDLTAFYNDYADLRTAEFIGAFPAPCPPLPPGSCTLNLLSFGNQADASALGFELEATWQVASFWRLIGSYSYLDLDVQRHDRGADPRVEKQDDDAPENQFQIRSRMDLPWDLELDTALYWVGDVDNQKVSEYTRLDLRLGWRPIEHLELSLVGQNLLEKSHDEYGDGFFSLASEVPRSVYGKATWRY